VVGLWIGVLRRRLEPKRARCESVLHDTLAVGVHIKLAFTRCSDGLSRSALFMEEVETWALSL